MKDVMKTLESKSHLTGYQGLVKTHPVHASKLIVKKLNAENIARIEESTGEGVNVKLLDFFHAVRWIVIDSICYALYLHRDKSISMNAKEEIAILRMCELYDQMTPPSNVLLTSVNYPKVKDLCLGLYDSSLINGEKVNIIKQEKS